MTLDYFHSKDSLHLSATKLFRDTLHIPFSPLPAGQIQPSDFFGDIKLHTDISHLYAIGIVNDLSKKDEEITIEKARDYDGIIIIAVQLAKALNRSALALIARQVNQSFNSKKIGNPAIVIFRYSNTISIATVERETRTDADWREGMKLRKVSMLKDIDIVKPHAAHERILLELQKNNASTYEEVYNHWIAKLNIKELNKSFFKKIANWYFWAVAKSRFPYEYLKSEEKHKDKTDDQLRELANQKAIIRFITRIIFVWFLKEKSLIPHSLFDEKSIGKLLKKFNTADSSDYYKAIIQNLFFATLNRQHGLRDFATDEGFHENKSNFDVNSLYRYEKLFQNEDPKFIMSLFDSIPFLNGGLFDSMDSKEEKILIDGFSRTKSKQAFMPDELFFSDSADFNDELHTIYQTKKGNYDVKGIFKIFEEYKFTIEENTPLENDIALDPYLLGEIFENLLAYYNPETGTTARKGTGSFYTPQEIVNYMVDQSLIAYINTQLELDLKDFKTIGDLSDKDKYRFVAKLSEIKILDPACGSGAFPMGVLYRMVDLLQTLDPDNKLWKQVQHDRIIGDKIRELEQDKKSIQSLSDIEVREKATQAVEDRLLELENVFNKEYYFDDYARKLYIIQNCIYGVDIQDMAIQISKLRFFLSLIIDQENKDIQPLPNLETKFVVANTLIGIDLPEFKIFGQEDKSVDTFRSIKDQIKEVRKQHFSATDRKSKLHIKAKDEALRKKLSAAIAESYSVFSEVDLASYEDEYIRTLAELEAAKKLPDMVQENIKLDMFGGQVVEKISIRKKKISELKTKLQQLEISINSITSDTQSNEIKRQADRIASWDIYNQNAQADWFDPDWMFGISDGFDVVIGNPPYVSAPAMVNNNNDIRKAISNSKNYFTLYQKWDLYIPFVEFGLQVLTNKGILTMIVPYPLTNQTYGLKLRELITNEYNLFEIVDLNGAKIFANATVSNCIPFISKSKSKNVCIISSIDEDNKIRPSFTQPFSNLIQDDKTLVWNLSKEIREKNKHSNMNVLGDYCYISTGMVLNADEKTAQGEFVKDDLISDTYDEIHCRKYIEAKDIEKYNIKNIRYLEYNTERCPNQLRRPTFKELYEVPKLMFNRLGILQVIFDKNQKLLHSDSMYCSVLWKDLEGVENKSISTSVKRYSNKSRYEMAELSKNMDLKFLLSILNSKYASILLANLRGGDYHIYPEHIRNIPIPHISKDTQLPFITLVNRILADKKEGIDTTALEHQIDVMVYHLYELSYEEAQVIDKELSREDYERYRL